MNQKNNIKFKSSNNTKFYIKEIVGAISRKKS